MRTDYIDYLKKIDKQCNDDKNINDLFSHLWDLWKISADKFSQMQHEIIKGRLRNEVETGNIKKCFYNKRIVQTKIFWRGRRCVNESKAILFDIFDSDDKFRVAFEQIDKWKKRKFELGIQNDNYICNRIIELCKNDGIYAKNTCRNCGEFYDIEYCVTAKVNIK